MEAEDNMDDPIARLTAPWQSYIPEVQSAAAHTFEASKASLGSNAAYGDEVAEVGVRNAEIDRANALRTETERLRSLKEAADPSNWRKVRKEDGGFDFLDGAGKKVSAWDYSKATGKNPAQVLSDSMNSKDLQFREEYERLEEVMSAVNNGDTEYFEKLNEQFKDDPKELAKIRNLQSMKPVDIMNRFRDHYQNVFSLGRGDAETGRLALPAQRTAPQKKTLDDMTPEELMAYRDQLRSMR